MGLSSGVRSATPIDPSSPSVLLSNMVGCCSLSWLDLAELLKLSVLDPGAFGRSLRSFVLSGSWPRHGQLKLGRYRVPSCLLLLYLVVFLRPLAWINP